MALKQVWYVDPKGRKWARGLPEGVPDSQAKNGVPLGPPSLETLGLPLAVEVALHNQLADRGLLTEKDVRRRLPDVQAALQTALRTDVYSILAIYQGLEADGGSA